MTGFIDTTNWQVIGVYVDFGISWCIATSEDHHEDLRNYLYAEIVGENEIIVTRYYSPVYGMPVTVYAVLESYFTPLDDVIIRRARNEYIAVLQRDSLGLFPKNAENSGLEEL